MRFVINILSVSKLHAHNNHLGSLEIVVPKITDYSSVQINSA